MCTRAILYPKPYFKSLKAYTAQYEVQRHFSAIHDEEFETVFRFPFVKYISAFNRLKIYQLIGTAISIPSTGVLEMLNVLPQNTFIATSIIGISGAVLWSMGSMPLNNSIGFIYINKDNSKIKISSVNFWGKRSNRIIPVEDWIPLLDMGTKLSDPLYLSPQLADGTKYKLFIKFGEVLNAKKIGQVLE